MTIIANNFNLHNDEVGDNSKLHMEKELIGDNSKLHMEMYWRQAKMLLRFTDCLSKAFPKHVLHEAGWNCTGLVGNILEAAKPW